MRITVVRFLFTPSSSLLHQIKNLMSDDVPTTIMNNPAEFVSFTPRDQEQRIPSAFNNGLCSPMKKKRGRFFPTATKVDAAVLENQEELSAHGLFNSQESNKSSQFSQEFSEQFGQQLTVNLRGVDDTTSSDVFRAPFIPFAHYQSQTSSRESLGEESDINAARQVVLQPPMPNPFLLKSDDQAGRKTKRTTHVWVTPFSSRYIMDFDEEGIIGEGNFSIVYKARRRLDGILYAVKKIKNQAMGEGEVRVVAKEVCALAALQGCPNIVQYFGSWIEDGHLYIQTELCGLGTLDIFVMSTLISSPEKANGRIKNRSTSFISSVDSGDRAPSVGSNSMPPQYTDHIGLGENRDGGGDQILHIKSDDFGVPDDDESSRDLPEPSTSRPRRKRAGGGKTAAQAQAQGPGREAGDEVVEVEMHMRLEVNDGDDELRLPLSSSQVSSSSSAMFTGGTGVELGEVKGEWRGSKEGREGSGQVGEDKDGAVGADESSVFIVELVAWFVLSRVGAAVAAMHQRGE